MYKVGDKVRVIRGLKEYESYGSTEDVVFGMLCYQGKIAEIKKVREDGVYKISCDNSWWWWPEKTLVPLEMTVADTNKSMKKLSMRRLTEKKRNHDGTGISKKPVVDDNIRKHGITNYGVQMITKLADYEDAEEQGLLLRLPCKIGSIVYQIDEQCSHPNDCGFNCEFCPDGKMGILPTNFTVDMIGDVGETVFLTREEAEEVLKKNYK